MRMLLLVLLALVLTVSALMAWRSHRSRAEPPPLGLVDGRLRACPERPNCVSSEAASGEHAIAALPYRGERAASQAQLEAALATLPRTTLVDRQEGYWRAQSVSGLFRFLDDLEFRFDDADSSIQLRSASRVGYSDLGVNRKRVEALRAAYLAQSPQS